ncbi:MAG: redoxin domain-containing protein [Clostridiales bacterium]|nr:redoxin domain-containing protein [Clostridiales bacterium]
MKKISKLLLLLSGLMIFALVISACQGAGIDPPQEPSQQEDGGSAGQEAQPPEQEGKRPADQGTDTAPPQDNESSGQDGQNNSNESIVDKSKINITLEKNVDYVGVGKPIKDFELEDLNGDKVRLSDYKGQIVFLNFWATWCPPCKLEMPDMEAIHKKYGDKGVKMLGVSSTELELRGGSDSEKAKKLVKEFIESEGFTFTIPLDPNNEVISDYKKVMPITGIPTTFMIDREGIIRFARPGAFLSEEQIEAFIALLEE